MNQKTLGIVLITAMLLTIPLMVILPLVINNGDYQSEKSLYIEMLSYIVGVVFQLILLSNALNHADWQKQSYYVRKRNNEDGREAERLF